MQGKIVDDILLYGFSTEGAFYHTFHLLCQSAKNGIVLNTDKFQFCQDVVQFGDNSFWSDPFWVHDTGDTQFSGPKDNYRYQIMVWAHQPGSLGILIGSSHAALLGPNQTGLQIAWNQSLEDVFKDSN